MDIGKLIALGIAAYLGYEYFLAPKSGAVSTSPGGIQPGPTPPVTQPTPAASAATTQSLVLAAAAKDNFTSGTVDQWDWYYGKARGIPAPDPISDWGMTDVTRNEILTFPEWWNLASSHGLSGRSGYVRG